jgi:hypothetical protein
MRKNKREEEPTREKQKNKKKEKRKHTKGAGEFFKISGCYVFFDAF